MLHSILAKKRSEPSEQSFMCEREVFQLLSEKKISPHIGARFPLSKAADAHAMQDSGDFFGSLILDLQG